MNYLGTTICLKVSPREGTRKYNAVASWIMERKSCEGQLMPFTTLLIDCLWIGMDYLTFCLKGCGLILPQLRWFFMFEGRNARKATKLNCKLPSMGTKL